MIVHVAVFEGNLLPAFSAIGRDMCKGIDCINTFSIVWINIKFVVILWAAGELGRALFPVVAEICGAIKAALLLIRFNNGVEDIWL